EVLLRAEALDPAQYGRAGQPSLSQSLEDRLVERPALPGVGLAEVDPDEQAAALELHQMALPMAMPAITAATPMMTLPARLAVADSHAPSPIIRQLSRANVEKVVYEPRKPMSSGPRR